MSYKHGFAPGHNARPEYIAWQQAKHRCHNHQAINWHLYGGRGIAVCPEWRESFEAFVDHIGRRPSDAHSLDRIDNDRGYEPGNVRWATRSEQAQNKRRPSFKSSSCDDDRAKWIVFWRTRGFDVPSVAVAFGVHEQTVRRIARLGRAGRDKRLPRCRP